MYQGSAVTLLIVIGFIALAAWFLFSGGVWVVAVALSDLLFR